MRGMSARAAIIGGGPAGLIAAETLARAGLSVTVHDRMPTLGRKLLMAGRGGLNLTHSEPLPDFLVRYGAASGWLAPFIEAFPPAALIEWCHELGQPTFVGSSGRVFPVAMKASPLLRAWLRRLAELGVDTRMRHGWSGWSQDGHPVFDSGATEDADVIILAVGGASWPRLGADGGWASWMADQIVPFQPSNCGFAVAWLAHLRSRFAGRPVKRVAIRFRDRVARGEIMITASGLEGGPIYTLSGPLREAIAAEGPVRIAIDLRPDLPRDVVAERLQARRGLSIGNVLRRQAGLSPEAATLVQEALHTGEDGADLAALIKAVPVRLLGPSGLERAISSAGGLRRDALDGRLMLRDRPGVFAAGEMLDWEAPTGGYLLQACFSTGVAAARGALAWLASDGA
jgi:uncharacterized flavoprotein (TIGR03862 family)